MTVIDLREFELENVIRLDIMPLEKPARKQPFLRGPIPIWWLKQAAILPGRALAVGIALWYRKGLTNNDTVKPSWKLWETFGMDRHSALRGLRNLEKSGLVEVERSVGKNPLVTISTKRGLSEE